MLCEVFNVKADTFTNSAGDPKKILSAQMLGEVFNVKADTFKNSAGDEIIFPLRKNFWLVKFNVKADTFTNATGKKILSAQMLGEVFNVKADTFKNSAGDEIIFPLRKNFWLVKFNVEAVTLTNTADKKIFAAGDPKKIFTRQMLGEVFNVKADTFKNSTGDEIIFPAKK